MFIVIEEKTFLATHRLQMADGQWEPLHEHEWLLRICIRSSTLDEQGLVVDFLDLQRHMDEAIAPYIGKEIGKVAPFDQGINPSAEYIAWIFYQALAPHIDNERAQLFRVELREAPTSWGIYEVD